MPSKGESENSNIMDVLINSKTVDVPDNCIVEKLFEIVDISTDGGIAIAINNQVIPKNYWRSVTLQPKDNILIIKAAKGG